MKTGFPIATDGLRIGLLGGSFDPPHSGHVHISRWALKEFGLDQVWWLVSPGNPLKSEGPADLDRRLDACQTLLDHPRIIVTDLERQFNTRYTAETLQAITSRYTSQRFVWLMGADNLASFHKWDRWDEIMQIMPIGVMARPGQQLAAGGSPAARRFRRNRLSARRSTALPFRDAPCWSLITGPMDSMSSTEIRQSGKWVR
ncbi:putative nicotinate-nucleotide adenylyltransferase [Amylibacter marinus]|uniref:Probable nicotinate-nucleotide adenylyltransferase n=1 Tax=Amylibacter marinus TaxID=1475483 RepID=A0ABQ5VRM8_9RHOB|nr:nicotinate-nucleotide adenylyltransferase [Amylibacter marinus]GLQ33816.1 putative nicotinate-nucleotide adenylyltransferase [Amylibacter marinus]